MRVWFYILSFMFAAYMVLAILSSSLGWALLDSLLAAFFYYMSQVTRAQS